MNFKYFYILVFLVSLGKAQTPIKEFQEQDFDETTYAAYAHRKKIPKEIRQQALIALSYYPELKNIDITFRLRKRTTPLTSRPRFIGVFQKKKNRRYVITISTKSNAKLAPILFSNLPYNAQIGVLGHELGHIAHYNTKNTFQIIGLSFKILKPKFVDSFEFNTDFVCIEHGLGYQLRDWSTYVRKALNIVAWKGAPGGVPTKDNNEENQRYMNPETISKYIEANSLYQTTN
ncbi:hypothetical protein [Spongiimicrobium salis]|uniref:hypothetical protein n=1 Tax=Spongiimicrobium salis TaxID=1667022 RepID=UPI00374D49C8